MAANRGTFATAQVGVPSGSGFGGGVIYFPTDTSQGKFGALAVVPGYTATWAAEGAWMGHWLASFGFVVIGIDTNSRNDWYEARGAQLLAALDYLTQRSSVRDRVDASRAAVMGHSMGGGGAIWAAANRPSLKATIGLAPALFQFNMGSVRVPAMLLAGQNDGTVTPSEVSNAYNQIPASTGKAYLELSGAGHGFPTSSNSVMTRKVIPWLKIFLDRDARYSQFLCPVMDNTGIWTYRSTCPLLPDAPPSPSASPTAEPSTSPSTPPSPTASPIPPAPAFNLVGVASGKCLDVTAASQTNGTGLVIYTCHTRANQRWTQTSANELRIYDSPKCMEAGNSAGNRAVINSCTGGGNRSGRSTATARSATSGQAYVWT